MFEWEYGLEWGDKYFWEEISYQLETGELCSWPWEDSFIGCVSNSDKDYDNDLEDYWEDEYWEDGVSGLGVAEGAVIENDEYDEVLKSYNLFETELEYPPLPSLNDDEYEQVCSFGYLGFNEKAYRLTFIGNGKEEADSSSDASLGRKRLECSGKPRGLYGYHQVGPQAGHLMFKSRKLGAVR